MGSRAGGFGEMKPVASKALSGTEDYCLLDAADYPPEIFGNEDNGLDIHAGAYESASIKILL